MRDKQNGTGNKERMNRMNKDLKCREARRKGGKKAIFGRVSSLVICVVQ